MWNDLPYKLFYGDTVYQNPGVVIFYVAVLQHLNALYDLWKTDTKPLYINFQI